MITCSGIQVNPVVYSKLADPTGPYTVLVPPLRTLDNIRHLLHRGWLDSAEVSDILLLHVLIGRYEWGQLMQPPGATDGCAHSTALDHQHDLSTTP